MKISNKIVNKLVGLAFVFSGFFFWKELPIWLQGLRDEGQFSGLAASGGIVIVLGPMALIIIGALFMMNKIPLEWESE